MNAKTAVAALLLVLCLGAPARAQFPEGLFDDVDRIASMPGAVTATAVSISGQAPYTSTTGTGNGGSAMASAANSANGVTKTSTTVNGVTKTTTSTNAGSSCTVLTTANGQVCDGVNKACCAVTSELKRCKNHVNGRVNVNSNSGLCCITLFREKDNSPALWCAGPSSPSYYSLPTSAEVQLKPSCMNYVNSKVGSLACIVHLPTMPSGFVAPKGYGASKPLVYNKGTNFMPCQGAAFSRVIQVDGVKDGKMYITAKCE